MRAGTLVDYSFRLNDKQVISDKLGCISAQEKSDGPISRIRFACDLETGQGVGKRQRDFVAGCDLRPRNFPTRIGITASVAPRGPNCWCWPTEFSRLVIRKGDHLAFSSSDRRTITAIRSTGDSKVISVDGPPIWSGEGGIPPIRIIRQ